MMYSAVMFFVSDLHGKIDRYRKLFSTISKEVPEAVFLGGDLLPSGLMSLASGNHYGENFVKDFLIKSFKELYVQLGKNYPRIFLILGNDDGQAEEYLFKEADKSGLWYYMHNRCIQFKDNVIFGYSFVPPSPFLLKDWERYDVSRYVDPGCVPPEEGYHSIPPKKDDIVYSTIKQDLDLLAGNTDMSKSIFLFHAPPYKSNLDRAALDGKKIDHVPLDVHVGSIAIRRFLEEKGALISLHGHVHESARITGSWKDKIGLTHAFSAAHDGEELALIRFSPDNPEQTERELI